MLRRYFHVLVCISVLNVTMAECHASVAITSPATAITSTSLQPAGVTAERIAQLVHQCARPGASASTAARQLRALPPMDLPVLKLQLKDTGLTPEVRAALNAAIKRVGERAITEARMQRRYNWYISQTLDAYQHVGDRNPKWNAAAENTLRLLSKQDARPAFDLRNTYCARGLTLDRIRIAYAAIQAIREGCHDPLIAMIADCNPFWRGKDRLWAGGRNIQADIRALMASHYSAAIKLQFLTAAAYRYAAIPDWNAAGTCANEDLVLMAQVVRESNIPISFLTGEIACNFEPLSRSAGHPASWSFAHDAIFKAIHMNAPARKLQYVYLFLQGYSDIQRAWQARESGNANAVKQNGGVSFNQRIQAARTALRKAYLLFPDQPEAPVQMMTVDYDLGHFKRMVKWFKRALHADPDNYQAFYSMYWALHAGWFGSAASLSAFDQWCLNYGHWNARIPFIALDGLLTLEAKRVEPAQWNSTNITYMLVGHDFWKDPAVWKMVQAIFNGYYSHRPKSAYHLGLYIFLCMWADKWKDVADRLHWYFHGPRHPQMEKIVQQFYSLALPATGYLPLGTYVGDSAVPTYFKFTSYSLNKIYNEAKLRLAHPGATDPWPVRRARRDARYMKWADRVTVRSYQKTSDKYAPGATDALRAMRDEASVLARPPHHHGAQRDHMIRAARSAMNAGCKDPLMVFFEAYNAMAIGGPDAINAKTERDAATQVLAGNYPVTDHFMAAVAVAQAALELPSAQSAGIATTMLTDAKHLLPQFAGDENIPIIVRFAGCRKLWLAVAEMEKSMANANASLAPLLAAGHAPPILVALMDAWEAQRIALDLLHGRALQGVRSLSPGNARTFLADLHKSMAGYHLAWMMNPDCTVAINGAISVQFWINMRIKNPWQIWPMYSTWFLRAFNADPDNLDACRIAMRFEAMCAKPYTGKWFFRDNNLLAELMRDPRRFRLPSSPMALVMLYGAQIILDHPATNAAAVQTVPVTFLHTMHIWRYLHSIMPKYLTAHPTDERAMSLYARVACELHHWNTAETEFQHLGSRARISAFGGRKMYLKLKAQAAQYTGQ